MYFSLDQIQLVVTGDGSHTLSLENLNESYHSLYGAIQESRHVYIEAGLREYHQNQSAKIQVLEVGFGTGLNALLTAMFAFENSLKIKYTAIETAPIPNSIIGKLNYGKILHSQKLFDDLHRGVWEQDCILNPGFSIRKRNIRFQDFTAENLFNIVYLDAFAPDLQPELWSLFSFQKLFLLTAPQGILVTYCSKGAVRRNMLAAGFEVDKLPGPHGKREILRATKPN